MAAVQPFSRLEAKRQEQVPQALARLVVVGLFIALWALFFIARMPMPLPFLVVLLLESAFFIVYLQTVPRFPTVRSIEIAQDVMLAAEILFHTTMVYFLGGLSWLGAFAYVFGLIFSNTFLDLRRGFLYTTGASLAFASLILLEATGAIPHYVFMAQGPERYADARFVTTSLIGGMGVFYSIYLWVNWVGFQLRQERDAAVRAQDGLLAARADLQRANEDLERRVGERTLELETVNAALRENESRLRTVIENAPVVLFSVDRDGIITLSEGKGLESLGRRPGETVGSSMSELYKDAPEVLRAIDRGLAGETFSDTVHVGNLSFEAHCTPILDENATLTGVIGMATDVTERQHVEAALRESEERYRTLIEGVGAIVWEADATTWRFSYVSHQAETILGYPMERWLNEPDFWVEHIHPDDRESAVGFCMQATAEGRNHEFDYRMITSDNRPVWLHDVVHVVQDEDGTPRQLRGIMIDITQRKAIEAALRESEERYRSLAENTFDLICEADAEARFSYVSPNYEEVLGYTPDELQGSGIFDLIHEDDRPAVAQEFARAVSTRTTGQATFRYRHKNGAWRWFESAGRAFEVQSGELRVAVISRDITQRRRAEEDLRQSEETLRGTIESTGDGILVLNEDVQVVHVNENFFKLWRMPEELRTTHSLEIYRDFVLSQLKDPDAYRSSLRDVFRTSAEGFDTVDLLDGRVFESHSRPLLRDGDAEGRVFSFRDVTQRKAAEEALRDSESKFRTMAETVATAVMIYQGTKIQYVNSAAEELTGYSREELVGMDFWQVIHPEYQGMVRERGMARQRGAGVPHRYEVKIVTKSGWERWVDSTAGVIDYEGKAGVLVTAFDITERKQAEEALREHANRDPLTGLLNRRAGIATLAERLQLARNEDRPFAVLVLDLDRFKSINDTFSHETGDNALLQFAQVMSDLVGDRGVVARLGGDEFEIGLDGYSVEEARSFADRVHADLRELLDNAEGDTVARFTVSIGIACSPEHADSLLQLGRLADKAMYEAKAAGGGRTRITDHAAHGRAA